MKVVVVRHRFILLIMYLIPIMIPGAFLIHSALIAGILAALNYFKVIVSGGRGKNGATVANTSVLFPAFPVAFVQVILFFHRYKKRHKSVWKSNPSVQLR